MLMTGQLKFENGMILIKNNTFNMLPSHLVAELTKYFDSKKKLTELYLLVWCAGYIVVKNLVDEFNLKTSDEIYGLGMDFAEMMGIGLYKTHTYEAGKFTHFEIESPYVKFFDKKDKKPVDHFIAGAMGGGGCLVHKSVCQCLELWCMIQGKSRCNFLTATESEFKRRKLWSEVEKRYEIKSILPIQQHIFEKYNGKNEEEMMDKLNEFL